MISHIHLKASRISRGAFLLSACLLTACASTPDAKTDLSATTIIESAYTAAGGDSWVRPQSLTMRGHAIFYDGATPVAHESHNMWRVYARDKSEAHKADGKVRITSARDGVPIIDVAFDGTTTSTAQGPREKSDADRRWASNFGFGVIRHALDDGYRVARLPNEPVDGAPAYRVQITDPTSKTTLFGIRASDFAVVKVAFDTERGWHERTYSDFFSKPGVRWQQPGRVRLTYDGVKSNEIIWTDFEINTDIPNCRFTLPETSDCGPS